MPQRTDNIFHDEISEAFGGSFYHSFDLQLVEASAGIDTAWEVAWIAPRAVRIINNRFVSTVLIAEGATDSTLDVFRNIGAGTNRAVITQIDPDDTGGLTADAVVTPVLSTATADSLAHVVVDQYGFFVMVLGVDGTATGPFNLDYMAHYSFEDIP